MTRSPLTFALSLSKGCLFLGRNELQRFDKLSANGRVGAMNDTVSALIQLQNEVIAAQKAQLDAMQQGLSAAGDLVKMQQAGMKAVEAQQKAWSSWMKLWGWK